MLEAQLMDGISSLFECGVNMAIAFLGGELSSQVQPFLIEDLIGSTKAKAFTRTLV